MRVFVALALVVGLASCAEPPPFPYASDERVEAVAYRAPGPNTLTIMTMVSNRSGKGAHTALMISGSQRVIFDPAGSFFNERVAEQEDVQFINQAVQFLQCHQRLYPHRPQNTFPQPRLGAQQAASSAELEKRWV